MLYIADSALADIPSLHGQDSTTIAQRVADAGRVLTYIRRNPWIDHDTLARYGERNLDPDRLNAAIALLGETGRLHVLEDGLP